MDRAFGEIRTRTAQGLRLVTPSSWSTKAWGDPRESNPSVEIHGLVCCRYTRTTTTATRARERSRTPADRVRPPVSRIR